METQDKCKLNQAGAFTTREFDTNKDYLDYKSWIEYLRNGSCPTQDQLSTIGLIIESEGQKICAGFLYISNSSIAFIEFVVANPKAHRNKRKEALKKLLTGLEARAIKLEYNYILIITNNKGFSNTLTKGHSYIAGAKSTEHYKTIWQ